MRLLENPVVTGREALRGRRDPEAPCDVPHLGKPGCPQEQFNSFETEQFIFSGTDFKLVSNWSRNKEFLVNE